VGSCRRDLLDHMVALNERHLKTVGNSDSMQQTAKMANITRDWLNGKTRQPIPANERSYHFRGWGIRLKGGSKEGRDSAGQLLANRLQMR